MGLLISHGTIKVPWEYFVKKYSHGILKMSHGKIIISHWMIIFIEYFKHNSYIYIGIEFYLFVSHRGMNDRGSTCKFRNARSAFRNLQWILCPSYPMRNKQVEFNPYIYTLSTLSCFGYEISVFKYTLGRYSEQPPEQPTHTSRLSLV